MKLFLKTFLLWAHFFQPMSSTRPTAPVRVRVRVHCTSRLRPRAPPQSDSGASWTKRRRLQQPSEEEDEPQSVREAVVLSLASGLVSAPGLRVFCGGFIPPPVGERHGSSNSRPVLLDRGEIHRKRLSGAWMRRFGLIFLTVKKRG